jgi:hypothetical protein
MQRTDNLGCFLCRARKVKCDERWPSCLNCERLKLECPGHPGQNSGLAAKALRSARRDATLTQAGTARHRVSKSCQSCRLAKARCSGGEICTRCSSRDIECAYSTGRKQQLRSNSAPNIAAHDESLGSSLASSLLQKNQFPSQQTPGSATNPLSWYGFISNPDTQQN